MSNAKRMNLSIVDSCLSGAEDMGIDMQVTCYFVRQNLRSQLFLQRKIDRYSDFKLHATIATERKFV